MKLYLLPTYNKPDVGDGGIRRVVEAQHRHLPAMGIDIVDVERDADVCAYHAMEYQQTNKPLVSHCHGMYWREYDWGKFASYINEKVMSTAKSADIVTCPSEWVAKSLRYELWIDPIVIPHGIELDQWPYSPEPDGYVLWNKARKDVISNPVAVDALSQRLMDVEFVTTFDIRSQPRRNVTVVGKVPYGRSVELVLKAGIYLATVRETFGIGTLEAMAAGKPILGYKWGGTADIVQHKVHGWLSEPGDFDDLLEGYHWIKRHYIELSQHCRHTIEANYQWKDVMLHYADVYLEVYENSLSTRNELTYV